MNSIFLLIEDNTIDQVVTAQLLRKMIGATQIFVVKKGIEAIGMAEKMSRSILSAIGYPTRCQDARNEWI